MLIPTTIYNRVKDTWHSWRYGHFDGVVLVNEDMKDRWPSGDTYYKYLTLDELRKLNLVAKSFKYETKWKRGISGMYFPILNVTINYGSFKRIFSADSEMEIVECLYGDVNYLSKTDYRDKDQSKYCDFCEEAKDLHCLIISDAIHSSNYEKDPEAPNGAIPSHWTVLPIRFEKKE